MNVSSSKKKKSYSDKVATQYEQYNLRYENQSSEAESQKRYVEHRLQSIDVVLPKMSAYIQVMAPHLDQQSFITGINGANRDNALMNKPLMDSATPIMAQLSDASRYRSSASGSKLC